MRRYCTPMRLLHFSDIHVDMPIGEVRFRDWMGKRVVGALNLLAGRGRRFTDTPRKLDALDSFKREQGVDLVIFTGDYTALGLEGEFERARAFVEPLMTAPAGFVNVPGNHDIYLWDVVRDRRFERHFGDTLESDLPEHRVEGPWPLVRLVGEHVAVVAVNSARPNPPPWRSSGLVPDGQLAALAEVLADERVRGRFVFVVTHYAPRLADGGPDRVEHRLVNAEAFLAVCADLPRGAILCGHVHHLYRVGIEGVRPPIHCAGSATMSRREGLWLFDVDGAGARATPVRWAEDRYVMDRERAAELELAGRGAEP
jgi:3',5'-cyclic AMP phosphodiesterase CpdA